MEFLRGKRYLLCAGNVIYYAQGTLSIMGFLSVIMSREVLSSGDLLILVHVNQITFELFVNSMKNICIIIFGKMFLLIAVVFFENNANFLKLVFMFFIIVQEDYLIPV